MIFRKRTAIEAAPPVMNRYDLVIREARRAHSYDVGPVEPEEERLIVEAHAFKAERENGGSSYGSGGPLVARFYRYGPTGPDLFAVYDHTVSVKLIEAAS